MKYRIIVHMLGDDEQIPGPVVELNEKQFEGIINRLSTITTKQAGTFQHTNEDGDTILIPATNVKYIKVERS